MNVATHTTFTVFSFCYFCFLVCFIKICSERSSWKPFEVVQSTMSKSWAESRPTPAGSRAVPCSRAPSRACSRAPSVVGHRRGSKSVVPGGSKTITVGHPVRPRTAFNGNFMLVGTAKNLSHLYPLEW